MCRLFGLTTGAERVRATFWLLDAPDSLQLQSHRNADGAGLGYFSPDGACLAAGDSQGNLTLWELESCRARSSWHAHGAWIRSVAFSADGRTLASAGERAAKLWEISGEGKEPLGK